MPAASDHDGTLPAAADRDRYGRLLDAQVEELLAADDPGSRPVLIHLADTVTRVMGYRLSPLPCGAGRGFIGVDARGRFFPCFRFIGMEAYRLGDIDRGLDRRAVGRFQERAAADYRRRPGCEDCLAGPLCGGQCFAVSECFGPGRMAPLPLHCGYVRLEAAAALRIVTTLRERAPEKLLGFLPVDPASLEPLG